nr:hypothetical protein [Kofleriaceae bacterium]
MRAAPTIVAATLAALACVAAPARADDGRLLGDRTFAVATGGGPYVVDAGLVTALPSALPSGIAAGIGAGIDRTCTCWLSYGARLAWDDITASSEAFTVTDQELRARATVSIRHDAGRGTLALRLGGGANVVYEDRTRNGGDRAGLMGSALETRALAALPAIDVEAVVGLRVAGAWRFQVSGGPSVELFDSALHGGFVAELGVGWQP